MFKYALAILACYAFSSFPMDSADDFSLMAPKRQSESKESIVANTNIMLLVQNKYPFEDLTNREWETEVQSFNRKYGYPDMSYLNLSLGFLRPKEKAKFYKYILSIDVTVDAKLIKLARKSEEYYYLNDVEWCFAVKQFNDAMGTPSLHAKRQAINFAKTSEMKKFLEQNIITADDLQEEMQDAAKSQAKLQPDTRIIYIKLSNKENNNPKMVYQHEYASGEHHRRWDLQKNKIKK